MSQATRKFSGLAIRRPDLASETIPRAVRADENDAIRKSEIDGPRLPPATLNRTRAHRATRESLPAHPPEEREPAFERSHPSYRIPRRGARRFPRGRRRSRGARGAGRRCSPTASGRRRRSPETITYSVRSRRGSYGAMRVPSASDPPEPGLVRKSAAACRSVIRTTSPSGKRFESVTRSIQGCPERRTAIGARSSAGRFRPVHSPATARISSVRARVLPAISKRRRANRGPDTKRSRSRGGAEDEETHEHQAKDAGTLPAARTTSPPRRRNGASFRSYPIRAGHGAGTPLRT